MGLFSGSSGPERHCSLQTEDLVFLSVGSWDAAALPPGTLGRGFSGHKHNESKHRRRGAESSCQASSSGVPAFAKAEELKPRFSATVLLRLP